MASASCSLSGLADADENCKRFMDRCMPEAFKKVSFSRAADDVCAHLCVLFDACCCCSVHISC